MADEAEPFSVAVFSSNLTEDDLRQTEQLVVSIPGGRELLDWFGGKLNFGDAEIISLELRRGGSRSLVVAAGGPGGTKRVTFVLDDWIDVALNAFSNQNVIGGLAIRPAGQRAVENWEKGVGLVPGQHEIVLAPIFGAYGVIRATITRIAIADRRGADRTF